MRLYRTPPSFRSPPWSFSSSCSGFKIRRYLFGTNSAYRENGIIPTNLGRLRGDCSPEAAIVFIRICRQELRRHQELPSEERTMNRDGRGSPTLQPRIVGEGLKGCHCGRIRRPVVPGLSVTQFVVGNADVNFRMKAKFIDLKIDIPRR